MKILSLSLFFAFLYACSSSAPQEEQAITVERDTIPEADVIDNSPKVEVSSAYVMGKFEPANDTSFVKIASVYTPKSGIYLHREAYQAFEAMYAAAKKDSISLRILSATRNFNYQKSLWENKWTGGRNLSDGVNAATIKDETQRAIRILEYSAMPGTSRHHWGTDIDLNAVNNSYFTKGKGLKEYEWLRANAASFGFCQPYSPKGAKRPNGYNEEKWHWSYLPLAKQYIQTAKDSIRDNIISGFKGAKTAPSIKVVEKYILGVSAECL